MSHGSCQLGQPTQVEVAKIAIDIFFLLRFWGLDKRFKIFSKKCTTNISSKVWMLYDDADFTYAWRDWQLGSSKHVPLGSACSISFLLIGLLGNLDQLFGLLSRRLSRSSSMVDADSVRQILEDEVTKPSMKKWINATVTVSIVRRYRNWKAHNVEHCPVQLETLVKHANTFWCLGQ